MPRLHDGFPVVVAHAQVFQVRVLAHVDLDPAVVNHILHVVAFPVAFVADGCAGLRVLVAPVVALVFGDGGDDEGGFVFVGTGGDEDR